VRELSVLDVAMGEGCASIAALLRAFQRHFGQPTSCTEVACDAAH